MNETLDLAPELSHKERIEQLKEMAKRDGKQPFWKVSRYEIKDVILEMNNRLTQYNHQSSYSTDFKVLQTVQDFQYLLIPLQTFVKKQIMFERLKTAKVNFDKPVASLKDGKMIWFNTVSNSFTLEKPKGS